MPHVKTQRVLMEFSKVHRWHAFVASRTKKKYKKKVAKKGAGRELRYEKEDAAVQQKLDATRVNEWNNWTKFSDGKWITREVESDKSEPGEEGILKSRLVVRGDLEDASKTRTDSPTASQLMLSLVFTLAARRDTPLRGRDISAAFLQGSKLDRTLILSQYSWTAA